MVTPITTPAANEVRIVGRLGAQAREQQLPSGDTLLSFTVVVDRPRAERHSRVSVDAIACVSSARAVRNRVDALATGTWVEATGVLRRRFWRSPAGLGSAMEVDVRRLAKVAAPGKG